MSEAMALRRPFGFFGFFLLLLEFPVSVLPAGILSLIHSYEEKVGLKLKNMHGSLLTLEPGPHRRLRCR